MSHSLPSILIFSALVASACADTVSSPMTQEGGMSTPPMDFLYPMGGESSAGTSTGGMMIGGMTTGGMTTGGTPIGGAPVECGEELCDGLDNDCDQKVDENLICACSEFNNCYGGPTATRDIGLCRDGSRQCDETGESWEECVEWVGPTDELCDELDNDCDGRVDEDLSGCGDCEMSSAEELCDGIDNDCDGNIDEQLMRECACNPNDSNLSHCVEGVWTECLTPSTETISIDIPNIGPGCDWSQGGNIDPESAVFAARAEQEISFTIAPRASLCSLSITGETPDFYFDDHLMLLLNQVPLIGSVNFASQFDIVDGLPRYEWSKIVGKLPGEVGSEPTCLDGATECLIPGTQSNGVINIAFNEMTNRLLANTSATNANFFTLVVTGDNDPDLDCLHSGLTMQVTYEYITNQ